MIFNKKTHTRLVKRRGKAEAFRVNIVRGLCRLFFVLFILFAIYYGTRLPFVTVAKITVNGGETISHDEIRSRIESILTGSYLGLIPKRFLYFLPYEAIKTEMMHLQRVESVSVERQPRDTLLVRITEHMPHSLACVGNEYSLCYEVTQAGYVYTKAPMLSGGTLRRHLLDTEGEITGTYIMPEDEFVLLHEFLDRLQEESIFRIPEIVHTKDNDFELRVNGGGVFRIARSQSLDESYQNLMTILASPEFSHIKPGNFAYVDLRFGDKVFVNETIVDTKGASTTTPTSTPEL